MSKIKDEKVWQISVRLISMILIVTMLPIAAFADEMSIIMSHSFPLISNVQLTNLDISISILYNDTYYENVLKTNEILTLELTAKNTAANTKKVQFFVAMYDSNDKMIEIALENSAISAGTTEEIVVSKFVSHNAAKAVVYILDNLNNTEPYIAFTMNSTVVDHYGNGFAVATKISNISKEIVGLINPSGDKDYMEFIAPYSGDFTFNCFSTSDVRATLYNSSQSPQVSNSTSFTRSLTKGQKYFLMVDKPSGTGEYLLSVHSSQPSGAQSFDIYKFDADVMITKNSILKICDDLYYNDLELSKTIYDEFEKISIDDAKLHKLPDFLEGHPKALANFDTLINNYFKTKYVDFMAIKQRYLDIIDNYSELGLSSGSSSSASSSQSLNFDNVMSVNVQSQGEPGEYIIGDMVRPSEVILTEEEAEINQEIHSTLSPPSMLMAAVTTPALTIVNTTATSVTFSVELPTSHSWGCMIYLHDFNTSNGIPSYANYYGNNVTKPSGQYTINNLVSGGIYYIAMLYSINGASYGGSHTINRFVKLPYNTNEDIGTYQNSNGRVTAKLETVDKALTSSGNFDTWLSWMDSTYDKLKELTGYTPYNGQRIVMQSTRANLNDYFGIQDGYDYFWIVCGYYDYTPTFKFGQPFYRSLMRRLSAGDWGLLPIHEMSHVFDNYKWEFDVETLAEFKTYYVIEQLNAKVYDFLENGSNPWYTGNNYYNYLKYDRYWGSYAESFNDRKAYASEGFAAILIDLQKTAGVGWEPFKNTFHFFNDLDNSQVPSSEGEKLKLFLTKLRDFSGVDVISKISLRDRGLIASHFDLSSLTYTDPVYPNIPNSGSGGSIGTTVPAGSYTVYQFKPIETTNYDVYTSPYGGTGVSNDTELHVYSDVDLTNLVLNGHNDDFDGKRFSKVTVYLTANKMYYIKVSHYQNKQLHTTLNITKNIPTPLSLGVQQNVDVATGEFRILTYTPTEAGTYHFTADSNNSSHQTYIKLYSNESMTDMIGQNYTNVTANLEAGKTYYLRFSGYLHRYCNGWVKVTKPEFGKLEFTPVDGGKYIFSNNPETITANYIVDQTDLIDGQSPLKQMIMRNELIADQNYIFSMYHHTKLPYLITVDAEFWAVTDTTIIVNKFGAERPDGTWGSIRAWSDYIGSASNIETGKATSPYIKNQLPYQISIQAGKRVWLSKIYEDLYGTDYPQIGGGSQTPIFAMMDFKIGSGDVNCNVMAYRRGIEDSNFSFNGGAAYEWDLHYKGIADCKNEVEATMDFVISDDAPDMHPLEVTVFNKNHPNGYKTTRWATHINPQSDSYSRNIAAQSDVLAFKYIDNEKSSFYGQPNTDNEWVFDVVRSWVRKPVQKNGNRLEEIDAPIPSNFIPNADLDSINLSHHQNVTLFDLAVSSGNWGVETKYIIKITNIGSKKRYLRYTLETSSLGAAVVLTSKAGYRYKHELTIKESYILGEILPAQSGTPTVTTFEFSVVMPTAGTGGFFNSLLVDNTIRTGDIVL